MESDKYALTFSNGPTLPTNRLLDSLKTGNVSAASFFMLGVNVRNFPSAAKRVQSASFSILAAAYNFVNMKDMAPADIVPQFQLTNDVFKDVGICRRPNLYRPPGGDYNDASRHYASRAGYRTVTWNVDTKDDLYAASSPDTLLSNLQTSVRELGSSGLHMQQDTTVASVTLVPRVRACLAVRFRGQAICAATVGLVGCVVDCACVAVACGVLRS